ncbi:hypothetical protein [Microvirga puerhi]|uniref:Nudix hydrolase domain-containing protein n=1 Tax=Microvirga puerhi TaxID=2876078 RepID=A0ABS7VW20_9HYPH|nr:hypothetical protein [Microvirga puerhi]MBZ6079162.1 hypothetical protein [Microvirga puerhi]
MPAPCRAVVQALRSRFAVSQDFCADAVQPVTNGCLTEGSDWLCHFVVATEWTEEPAICEPDKHDALLWAPIPALFHDLIPYLRWAIQHIEQRQPDTEYG